MSDIHNITNIKTIDDEFVGIGEDFELEAKPFWKSTIIRTGIVIVAVTIVKTIGRVAIAKNNAKHNL